MRFSEGVHRLHWATVLLRTFLVMVIYFVTVGFSLLVTQTPDGFVIRLTPEVLARFLIVTVPVGVVVVLASVWSWLALRFWIAGDDLAVETGFIRRRKRLIPLSRIQAIDVVRPLITRIFGLAEVRVELAGGDKSEIALRYLGRDAGKDLRAELIARAAGLPGHTPEAPERPLWRVPAGALLGSLLLKVPVIGGAMLFILLIAFGIIYAEAGVLAVAIPTFLGLLRAVVAPFVMYGNFTAATSPDGLRLRYGMLETRMQTVPPGRVQAVGIVEPLMWRSFGWVRLDVTVAGYAGERQALSSVLLPLAPRYVAVQMISQVFPGTNVETVPLLPASSKSPLARGAGAGTDDVVFVARHGAVCRRTEVIAHARAQSVRLTAGPLQRLLGLGTVHIDAPPGPVQVSAVHRDLGEARAIAESTAQRARAARAAAGNTARWAR